MLRNVHDENSVINTLDPANYQALKNENLIFAGMIPKLDNAFIAIKTGVSRVIIGDGMELLALIKGTTGTTIHG